MTFVAVRFRFCPYLKEANDVKMSTKIISISKLPIKPPTEKAKVSHHDVHINQLGTPTNPNYHGEEYPPSPAATEAAVV